MNALILKTLTYSSLPQRRDPVRFPVSLTKEMSPINEIFYAFSLCHSTTPIVTPFVPIKDNIPLKTALISAL